MQASILRVKSALNFFTNEILISWGYFKFIQHPVQTKNNIKYSKRG